MKKVYLLISIALVLFLSPSLLTAQTRRPGKTAASKTKVKTKTVKKPTAVANEPQKPASAEQPKVTAQPQNTEPTEDEMKEGLINGMVERGGTKMADGSVEVNNAMAGSIVRIEAFEKHGCKAASFGSGYFCNYTVTVSMKLRSNDGTSAGDRQVGTWNEVFNRLRANSTTATTTKRFVRRATGWIAIDE